jgi:hypothetical protein
MNVCSQFRRTALAIAVLASVAGLLYGGTIKTNKAHYAVGEPEIITGSGFTPNAAVHISVKRPDNLTDTIQGVIANEKGEFSATYRPSSPALPGEYQITVTESAKVSPAAVTTTKAGAADLDQCRNGSSSSPNNCVDLGGGTGWVNGNVGSQQGHFAEGYSIPYRMKFTGISEGTWTVDISYDTTQNNKHAIDFLTRYDWMNDPLHLLVFGHGPECVDPPDAFRPGAGGGGTPAVCDPVLPPTSVFPIPAPAIPYSLGSGGPPCTPGLPVGNVLAGATSCPGDRWNSIFGSGHAYFSLWGGTITTVYYLFQDAGNQDKTTRIRVVFTVPAGATTALLSWGGHIAREQDWGTGNSASGISGSPYHMRLEGFCSDETPRNQLCTAGGNQDRSLSAAVVFRPPSLTLKKVVVNDNGGTATKADFTLAAAGPVTISGKDGEPAVTGAIVQAGTYTLSETGPAGYDASQWSCVKNGGTPVSGSSISLQNGDSATCTITNNDKPPKLIVIKTVVNDNGGTKAAGDFNISVSGTNVSPASFAGKASPGQDVSLNAGSYNVSETVDPAYEVSYSADCSGTIALGQTRTCTITNNDKPPKLIVIKTVVNDNGGTKAAGDFSISVSGTSVSPASFTGKASPGQEVSLNAGSYSVTETVDPAYEVSYSADCSGTIALGQTRTCTITNNDKPPKLIVIKTVVNDNGGTKAAGDFSISVSGTNVSPASFAGKASPGQDVSLNAGSYSVSETVVPGYAVTYSADCSGTIALGQTKTCTITNNDIAPKLTLVKVVVNNNGGTALPTAWTLNASGPTPISGVSGATQVTNREVNAGNYTLSETGGMAGYSLVGISCVKNAGAPVAGSTIALGLADVATCTFTNDDQPSFVVINKVAKGGDGTFGFTLSGPTPHSPSVTTAGGTGTSGALQVNAGAYTLNETSLPPNWVLTASTCEVNSQTFGTPTVVNGVNVSWALDIPLGTTVTCTFDNSMEGTATRTQGFWATHTGLANTVWATVSTADASLCTTPITAIEAAGQNQLMGGFWANISQTTLSGAARRRTDLDQARMQMLQQYLAAVLNVYKFGTPGVDLAAARTAYCGTDISAIKAQIGILGAYNESGDSVAFTPGVSATPKLSREQANLAFWNITLH